MNLKLTIGSKNIGDLYRGISDFKKGYQPKMNIVVIIVMRRVILLQTTTVFWLGRGTISLSC
jgi:hypothetical protein